MGVNGDPLRKLNERQRRAVLEWVACGDTVQAGVRAGYTKKSAPVVMSRLLKRPDVKNFTRQFRKKQLQRCEIEADHVLQVLVDAVFLNPYEFFQQNSSGRWVAREDPLPAWVGRLVVKARKRTIELPDGTILEEHEVELFDKVKAAEMLAKHFGLLEPISGQSGVDVRGVLDALTKPATRVTMADRVRLAIEERKNGK